LNAAEGVMALSLYWFYPLFFIGLLFAALSGTISFETAFAILIASIPLYFVIKIFYSLTGGDK